MAHDGQSVLRMESQGNKSLDRTLRSFGGWHGFFARLRTPRPNSLAGRLGRSDRGPADEGGPRHSRGRCDRPWRCAVGRALARSRRVATSPVPRALEENVPELRPLDQDAHLDPVVVEVQQPSAGLAGARAGDPSVRQVRPRVPLPVVLRASLVARAVDASLVPTATRRPREVVDQVVAGAAIHFFEEFSCTISSADLMELNGLDRVLAAHALHRSTSSDWFCSHTDSFSLTIRGICIHLVVPRALLTVNPLGRTEGTSSFAISTSSHSGRRYDAQTAGRRKASDPRRVTRPVVPRGRPSDLAIVGCACRSVGEPGGRSARRAGPPSAVKGTGVRYGGSGPDLFPSCCMISSNCSGVISPRAYRSRAISMAGSGANGPRG